MGVSAMNDASENKDVKCFDELREYLDYKLRLGKLDSLLRFSSSNFGLLLGILKWTIVPNWIPRVILILIALM